MLGIALCLPFALTGCTAPLPVPPTPPAVPPVASVGPPPAPHAPVARAASTRAAAAPPAKAGTTPTAPPGPVAGFSPDTIAKVRRAMQNVTSLSNLFTAEMASTSDPKIQGAIYADFEKKYTDAVVAQGLSMSTYLQVLAAATKDPKLSEELNGPGASAAHK
ncbi:MAG TPA: DUF4168 domain-containing protein [Acetobacteraceae bacterium]|nr:DUF4168 domain-containing protein [Acetobacteraceae bacterium]